MYPLILYKHILKLNLSEIIWRHKQDQHYRRTKEYELRWFDKGQGVGSLLIGEYAHPDDGVGVGGGQLMGPFLIPFISLWSSLMYFLLHLWGRSFPSTCDEGMVQIPAITCLPQYEFEEMMNHHWWCEKVRRSEHLFTNSISIRLCRPNNYSDT